MRVVCCLCPWNVKETSRPQKKVGSSGTGGGEHKRRSRRWDPRFLVTRARIPGWREPAWGSQHGEPGCERPRRAGVGVTLDRDSKLRPGNEREASRQPRLLLVALSPGCLPTFHCPRPRSANKVSCQTSKSRSQRARARERLLSLPVTAVPACLPAILFVTLVPSSYLRKVMPWIDFGHGGQSFRPTTPAQRPISHPCTHPS